MKHLFILLVTALLLQTSICNAQLQEESIQTIFTINEGDTPYLLEPDHSFEHSITFNQQVYPVRRFLRVVGGIKMPGRFSSRGETLFREAEFLIDDHLDSINTYKDRYSLYFTGNNDPFEQYAYNRISIPILKPGKLTVELSVKKENLQVFYGGHMGLQLQLYFKKEGRHTDEVYDTPDSILYMPIPSGSSRFKVLKKDFELPANVATALVRVGGIHFSGKCWMEAPRFYQSGKQIKDIPFAHYEQRDNDYNYWVGINLVSRSWPMWKLEFKGKTIFQGNIFDRASDIADFYIPLPENLNGEGDIKLTLMKEPHKAAFPYELRRIQLIEESARDFEIVSVPKYVSVGDTAGILIEINKPNTSLQVTTDKAINLLPSVYTFDKAGLHTISFIATKPAVNASITISNGKDSRKGLISQTISKIKDNIYLSSGDEIHIDNEFVPYDYFFKWYIRGRVGNWYQFRPSYQWSGVRITGNDFVTHYTGLLNGLHIPYAWQVEGRTLASTRINPPVNALNSPMFRGKQAHENDGGYYYWQHFQYTGLHSDMAARTRPYGGIFAKHRPIYTDHGIFIHYDPYGVKDMADGANKFVANLSYSRGESTRHTGPSTSFKYLYQAGYDWLGAEQMYGPEDIIMSALRGASRVYGKKDFGSLHAVQWGSYPFTDPKHSLRFYMSLAVSYMHGASHINTEEGLWTDEYANDRFTKAGEQHMYSQHQILDYIETHGRQGELNTKIAVMHGRNDPWKSFGRQYAWSQKNEKWKFSKAMESFDLLNVFYPEAIVNGCGPEGWFTSTPYGPIDILPVEASDNILSQYKLLIFLGWNSFNNTDFIRIQKFVEQGGALLLTAAHLNSELQPDKPVRFPDDDTVIKKMLGIDYKTYQTKTEIPLGKGKIIYYPQHCYPADQEIKAEYTKSMQTLAAETIKDEPLKGWVKATPFIDFTVWDAADLRTLYILNVDWQSDSPLRQATLLLNSFEFPVEINKYSLATIRCKDNLAAMPQSNTSDILSIEEQSDSWQIIWQTTAKDEMYIFNALNGKTEKVQASEAGIHTYKKMK